MRNVFDISTIEQQLKNNAEQSTRDNNNAQVVKVVDMVFLKIATLCYNSEIFFKDINKFNAIKNEWFIAFKQRGFDAIQKVERGLNELRANAKANPPMLSEFLKWCEPTASSLQLLSATEAYNRAIAMSRPNHTSNNDDLSVEQLAVIKHARDACGSAHDFYRMSHVLGLKLFERNYIIAIRDLADGSLKVIPLGLADNRQEGAKFKPGEVLPRYATLSSPQDAFSAMRQILGYKSDAISK